MKIRFSLINLGIAFGIASIGVFSVVFLLILNWFFQITPYQELEGFPLMITIVTSPIAIVFGFFSIKIYPNKIGKWGIISNTILLTLPFLYWYLGTFIWGP